MMHKAPKNDISHTDKAVSWMQNVAEQNANDELSYSLLLTPHYRLKSEI